MPIKYMTGDATRPMGEGRKMIIHVVNDVGAWGAGFVLALSKRWDLPEKEYKTWHKNKCCIDGETFELGNIQFIQVDRDIGVVNMLAQHEIVSRSTTDDIPLQYDKLKVCLKKVADLCKKYKCSVHAPKIGARLAGGDWQVIEKMIIDELVDQGVDVTIYLFNPHKQG